MATATLDDFLAEYRRLIHDPADVLVTTPNKIANINTALKQRDMVTGGNRTLVSFTLTANDGDYSLTDLGNTAVFDVVGIALQFVGLRILLNQCAYTVLVRDYGLSMINYRDVPRGYARYGAVGFRLAPIPSMAYVTEWDCCQIGSPLSGLTDVDALPYPWTEPVPYYAAHLGMINAQRYDEAEEFKTEFFRLATNIEGSRAGLLPNAYAGR